MSECVLNTKIFNTQEKGENNMMDSRIFFMNLEVFRNAVNLHSVWYMHY